MVRDADVRPARAQAAAVPRTGVGWVNEQRGGHGCDESDRGSSSAGRDRSILSNLGLSVYQGLSARRAMRAFPNGTPHSSVIVARTWIRRERRRIAITD